MLPRQLRAQKNQPKRLAELPPFKVMKKGKLPRPFSKMGGSRMWSTGLIDVSDSHQVIFIWRDGDVLTDRSFFAWLFKKASTLDLYPLLEMHWHPSHKGLHIKMPCRTDLDYSNRQLPGAPELDISIPKAYDPKIDDDRMMLIGKFCLIADIKLGEKGDLWS